MMKLRKWALLLGGLFVFGSFGVYVSWDVLKTNDQIKILIEREAGLQLGEEINIQNARLGFGYIALDDLEFSFSEGKDVVKISELRLGWNTFDFIKSWFEPQKGVTEINLIKPTLVIGSNFRTILEGSESVSKKGAQLLSHVEEAAKRLFDRLQNVENVVISDGTIAIKNNDGSIISVAKKIEGRLSRNTDQTANLELDASIFDASYSNLQLTATVDLNDFRFDTDISIQDYDLGDGLPEAISEKLLFTDGILNGRINIKRNSLPDNEFEFSISGGISIKDAKYRIINTGLTFTEVNLASRIEQNRVIIEALSQKLGDSTIDIKGSIDNPLKPDLNLIVSFSGINPEDLVIDSTLAPLKTIQGELSGNMSILGEYPDIYVSGHLQSTSLSIESNVLKQFDSDFSFHEPNITFENMRGRYRDTEIDVSVSFNIDSQDSLKISGEVKGDLLSLIEDIPQLNKNDYQGTASFELSGRPDRLSGHGSVLLSSINSKGSKTLEGTFRIGDEIILQGRSLDNDFEFQGTISSDMSEYQFLFKNAFPFIRHELDLPGNLGSDLAATVDLTVQSNNGVTVILVDAYSTESRNIFSYRGNYIREEDGGIVKSTIFVPISENFVLEVTADISRKDNSYLISNIHSEDLLNGSAKIVKNGKMNIQGSINVSSSIEKFNELFGFELLDEGRVEGEITLKGTVGSPEINGTFDLVNGAANSLTGISGNLKVVSKSWTDFEVNELILLHNSEPILEASGTVDFSESEIDFKISGTDIPLNLYNLLIFPDRELLQGNITFVIQYSANEFENNITGRAVAPQGKIGMYQFNDLEISLASPKDASGGVDRSDNGPGGLVPKGFWFDHITLTMLDGVEIKGDGFLSVSSAESDFDLTASGNLLSVFEYTDSFFNKSGGRGSLDLNIGGNLSNPRINSGTLSVNDSYLYLNDVIDKIENIRFEAELLENSRFIDIKELRVSLDGKEAWIENSPDVEIKADNNTLSLFPFVLMDDGLNLGIVTLNTSDEGVDLHIPDLMESKEAGNWRFAGANDNEEFYFAGSSSLSDNPYVRGAIFLQDNRITYPPLEIDEDPGFVKRYLNIINWDLRAIPQNNNFYVRKEPSSVFQIMDDIFGDVLIELKIEDETEGLYFEGVVDEESGMPFNVSGDLISIRGTIETLLEDFMVESFELYFNQGQPYIKGSAKTTLKDPDINTGTLIDYVDVFLILVSDEKNELGVNTGNILDYGTWDDNDFPTYRFQLSLDQSLGTFTPVTGTIIKNEVSVFNQVLTTEGRILKLFGITPENIDRTALKLAGDRVGEVLLNPLTDPFNRSVRKWTGLDEFDINTRIRRTEDFDNLFPNVQVINTQAAQGFLQNLYLSPELRVGKYLSPSLYLLYESQYVRTINEEQQDVIGLNHNIGLQYRMPNNMLFEVQYDYDFYRYANKGDAKLWFRHQIRLTGIKKS